MTGRIGEAGFTRADRELLDALAVYLRAIFDGTPIVRSDWEGMAIMRGLDAYEKSRRVADPSQTAGATASFTPPVAPTTGSATSTPVCPHSHRIQELPKQADLWKCAICNAILPGSAFHAGGWSK